VRHFTNGTFGFVHVRRCAVRGYESFGGAAKREADRGRWRRLLKRIALSQRATGGVVLPKRRSRMPPSASYWPGAIFRGTVAAIRGRAGIGKGIFVVVHGVKGFPQRRGRHYVSRMRAVKAYMSSMLAN